MIEIKRLEAENWQDGRDIRLRALKNDSAAFSSSWEEESGFSEEVWKQRIGNAIYAYDNDKCVGMIVCLFNTQIKVSHIAEICAVYVDHEHRGKGIGKKLVQHALDYISENKKISKIKLVVNPDQKEAVKLYGHFGFNLVGTLKDEICVNNIFYDGLVMEKYITKE